MKHYFAYGSNLNAHDLAAHCDDRGHAPFQVSGEAAWLPDHRPVFHYRSQSRLGGALDVMRSRGHIAAGAVFTLNPEQVAVLDAKESAGVNYEKKEVLVMTGGELRPAFTYVVREEKRRSFVAPTTAYLNIVRRGYADFGHDASPLLDVARGATPPPLHRLFVYGTLMRGQCREHLLVAGAPTPATLSGMELHDLGEYPGMKPAGSVGTPTHVHGEVYNLSADTLPAVLGNLDDVEDFLGYEDLRRPEPRSMYVRTLVHLNRTLTWTYQLTAGFEGTLIASGDWRRRDV